MFVCSSGLFTAQYMHSIHPFAFVFKGHNSGECAACAPDPAPQTGELDDLGVIDEQVRPSSLVLNVVRKHIRLCGLEPKIGLEVLAPQ